MDSRAILLAAAIASPALLAASALGAAPGAPTSAAAPAAQAPKLVVEQNALDLGTVAEGQEVVGTFVLKNEGQAELRIIRAKPS
ncbi:MAG: hypothetical protein JSV80_13005 [Acidobacteriota bacterium]|nr:MAG: hypothetical protein JSV80_13005 [Acidobacteriota bacterium]